MISAIRASYWLVTLEERRRLAIDGEVIMAPERIFSTRELNPFEKLVLGLLCEGKTNSAIARQTSHTEKVIENTVSRAAKAFSIKSDSDTNIRVLLALAFRSRFGDLAFDQLGVPCSHMEINSEGQALCNRENH
jgi:DNA-binding CsgD family transcriptional regulator